MSIIFIDTETNGLSNASRVIEFAYTKTDSELNIISKGSHIINPGIGYYHSPEAESVHKITEEMVVASNFTTTDMLDLIDELNPEIMVAHNLTFDYKMIALEYKRLDRPMPTPKLCCTMKSSQKYLELSQCRLNIVHEYFYNKKVEIEHRAMQDVEMLIDIYKKLVSFVYIQHFEVTPVDERILMFGKHKGKSILDCPKSYQDWVYKTIPKFQKYL